MPCRATFVVLAAAVFAESCRHASDTDRSNEVRGIRRPVGETVGRRGTALGLTQPDSGLAYAGHDARGIPHYARRPFSEDERLLLRGAYGISDPTHLYVSDSTDEGLLKYDTRIKRCASCYVNSYVVGFTSVRWPGESWEDLERRVRSRGPADFPVTARDGSTSLSALDPDVQREVRRMLDDARRAGYVFHVSATYRSPEREAYLLAMGRGQTHTLTSLHSYGRAIDVVVDDGRIDRARTRNDWIAFRRWVLAYPGGPFQLLGSPSHTWDWTHIGMPSDRIGFRSIEAAVARARKCLGPLWASAVPTPSTADRCDFPLHLPVLP